MQGAARHHPDVERWCIVNEFEIPKAKALFGHLANVIASPRKLAGIPDELQIGVGKLFSVELPADRVAYVDADAVLCRPAPELWETEPGKVSVIKDCAPNVISTVARSMKEKFQAQFPDFCDIPCFNGGVWSLAPADFPNLVRQYEEALAAGNYNGYHFMFDQALLNVLFRPNLHWLPFQFNVNNLFDRKIPADARVVHFTGGVCKPWSPQYPKHEPQYYWWLKHGLNETRRSRLLAAKLKIWLWTPKRILGRKLRKLVGRSQKNQNLQN